MFALRAEHLLFSATPEDTKLEMKSVCIAHTHRPHLALYAKAMHHPHTLKALGGIIETKILY